MDQQERLADFHRTISEQLNSRLEESPRFFWALVAISTAYGYALWEPKSDPLALAQREIVVRLTAILAYLATLWASWYLAALGYAFRFLQNTQHCIEHALGGRSMPPKTQDRRIMPAGSIRFGYCPESTTHMLSDSAYFSLSYLSHRYGDGIRTPA